MVQADSYAPKDIIAAMKAGKFYASQGPAFESVEVQEDSMIVRTSPVSRITFFSNVPWVSERTRTGEGLVEHVYPLQKHRGEKWVRCEVVEENGNKAWLSPVVI